MHKCPRNAPELPSTLHETCTDCALAVRFEDFTAPYKTGNPAIEGVIPVHAGIQRLSETGPNLAQQDAQVPPECTGIAFNLARNMH